MNKFKMFLRMIEDKKQCFQAYIKKYGYIKNLGQNEYSYFRKKVNLCDEITLAKKADLCDRFTEMLSNL